MQSSSSSGSSPTPSTFLIVSSAIIEGRLINLFLCYSNLRYFNGERLPNGLVPTVSDVAANPSLTGDPSDLSAESDKATSPYLSEKWMKEIGDDIYKAHDVCKGFKLPISLFCIY
jgi:hypothetical protein